MYLEKIIRGKYVDIKSLDESDAEFTLNLRKDPEMAKYLPPLNISLDQQKEWIRKQRETEGDYFWVMLDKEGNRFGTFGIYDVNLCEPKGRSLAAKGNPLQNIEGMYLIFKYAFETLNVEKVLGWVYAENVRAARFAELFGALPGDPVEIDGQIIREYAHKKKEFQLAEGKVRKMLYRE